MLVWSHSFIHSNEQREQGEHQPPCHTRDPRESSDYKNHFMENRLARVHVVSTTMQSALKNISGGRKSSWESCAYRTGTTLITSCSLEPLG